MRDNVVYELEEVLVESDLDTVIAEQKQAVIVVDKKGCTEVLNELGIFFEGEVNLQAIRFCKLETQQEYLYGTLAVPKLLDISGPRYRMCFFITKLFVVIVDDSGFASRILAGIRTRRIHQGENKGRFLFNFLAEIIDRDYGTLDHMERELMKMEEKVGGHGTEGFHDKLSPIRRELLILRSYYNELVDVAKNLQENENGYFSKKQTRFFDTVEDRADRLMNKTVQLLEYAGQVKDAYQSAEDGKQNRNMQILTIISTVFLPLTLITSWYGMNFKNMPELEHGYPFVAVLCGGVIVGCIWYFKKKGLL